MISLSSTKFVLSSEKRTCENARPQMVNSYGEFKNWIDFNKGVS